MTGTGFKDRRTIRYLGTRIRSSGEVMGIAGILSKLRKKALGIKRISRGNPDKGLILFRSIIGGVIRFFQQRTEISEDYWRLMKTALALPRSLKHECLRRVVLERDGKKNKIARELFDERIRMMRFNGTVLGDSWRFRFDWNEERIMEKDVRGLRREIDLLTQMKIHYGRRSGTLEISGRI